MPEQTPPVSSRKPPRKRRRRREPLDQRALRAFPPIVRYSGLLIAFYEVLFEHTDRPGILAMAGSMMAGSFVVEIFGRRGGGDE